MDYFNIAKGFVLSTRAEFGIADQDTERLAMHRYKHCLECPILSNNKTKCDKKKAGQAVKDFKYDKEQRFKGNDYKGCGCILGWKVRVQSEKCPLGSW